MNTGELDFMVLACEVSEAHENGSVFIDEVEPLIAAMKQKGLTEKDVWHCQLALKRSGHIRLHGNYNVEDVDQAWSQAAPEFTITPYGLRWWLIRKHGQARYAKMVDDVRRMRDECVRTGVTTVAAWAERLNMPLVLVQRIMHAERL
jgi:hypothetical protein